MSTAALERRYNRLIALYPAEFRRARGAEMLGTLLDAAQDGRHPTRREEAALIVGALRQRAGRDRRQDEGRVWLGALRAATLMLLGTVIVNNATPHLPGNSFDLLPTVELIVCSGAAVAIMLGRYRLAALIAAIGCVACLRLGDAPFDNFWYFAAVALLLPPLDRYRPEPARGLLRYAILIPAAMSAAYEALWSAAPGSEMIWLGLMAVFVPAALLWIIVDERVAMALGIMLTVGVFCAFGYLVASAEPISAAASNDLVWWTVVSAALTLAGAATARRRARA